MILSNNNAPLRFVKMQALGNDYVYIETITQKLPISENECARIVSKDRFGVGSDGMILICPSEVADFRMRVFNPDGSEAEMCGNALRSTAKFVYCKGFTTKSDFTVETLGGIKHAHLHIHNGEVINVTAAIGAPILEASRVPVTLANAEGKCIDMPLTAAGRQFNITAISLGNPHVATYIDDTRTLDLTVYGSAIENSIVFPKKANVEFVTLIDKSNLFLRTWERNCGETRACGTGCCTAVVAGYLTGRCLPEADVHQLGGIIHIKWDTAENCLYMTGKTEIVFEGEIEL